MDSALWKAAGTIVRWVAGLWGLFQGVAAIRELVTRQDRDVLVEMIGSVISLHSIYFGAAAVGGVLALAAAIPAVRWLFGVIEWVWTICERRRAERTNQAISKLERLQSLTSNELSREYRYTGYRAENLSEIRVLTRELKEMGLRFRSDAQNFSALHHDASTYLPQVRKSGIDQVVQNVATGKESI